ncbi:transcriptional regulator, TetR family [Singulisphaera sp. GP187]|uniref:TetR/AcrR family transcriptional regulator n=1 Tax=Singulisphaera sp. GP187 TaxID=1882752 RepID=UPI0009262A58|nr:TetR/AcrR family transcriptional regulator [Singulisphaera sp. GP187]SIO61306.1 transcriptional regulator, TetR family [Singulisphaera sp. GP187]
MRYAAGHKARTRAKIVQAAGKVFRREGYHAAGIDMVMEEAGLTAGGFYAHFPSKAALLAEALAPAAAEAGVPHDQELEGETGRTRTEAFIDRYLAPRHMRDTEGGCPLPALASEVARTGGPVKASFEAIVRDLAARLKDQADGELSEDRALAILALCVGGLGVARSVQDKALGERILASCRDLAKASLVTLPAPQTSAATRNRETDQ